MGLVTTTAGQDTSHNLLAQIRTYGALVGSGFRRHATYRQATVAGAVTNTVFGLLKCYVLLAVTAGAGGVAAGYDSTQIATYVWISQGLLAVVLLWGWTELAERITTGDIAVDLLRPIHPVTLYLATDLGRAGHAVLFRFLPLVVFGALTFDLYLPDRPVTWPLFVISAVLAVVISFACRYLVNATAYWLLDARGPVITWTLAIGVLCGLYFPLRFLSDWLAAGLYLATPFPSILQIPIDVYVERDPAGGQAGLVSLQAGWAAVTLALCGWVQHRAARRLVVQGG